MSETQDDPFERAALAAEKSEVMFAKFNEREQNLYNGTICALCLKEFMPEELDDPNAIHVHVESWVSGPKLQSPVLRRQTGKRAHTTCIHKIMDGEAPDQEPIPGLED